jgi:hypothetical protein
MRPGHGPRTRNAAVLTPPRRSAGRRHVVSSGPSRTPSCQPRMTSMVDVMFHGDHSGDVTAVRRPAELVSTPDGAGRLESASVVIRSTTAFSTPTGSSPRHGHASTLERSMEPKRRESWRRPRSPSPRANKRRRNSKVGDEHRGTPGSPADRGRRNARRRRSRGPDFSWFVGYGRYIISLVLRGFGSDKALLLPGVRREIVHRLFTSAGVPASSD